MALFSYSAFDRPPVLDALSYRQRMIDEITLHAARPLWGKTFANKNGNRLKRRLNVFVGYIIEISNRPLKGQTLQRHALIDQKSSLQLCGYFRCQAWMACVGRGASQRFSTRAQLDDYIWLYFDDKCTKPYSCVLITKSTPDGWAGNWSIEYKSEEVDDLPSFSITWRYRMILNRPLKIKNRFRWNRSKKTLQLRSAYFSFSTTSISLSRSLFFDGLQHSKRNSRSTKEAA